MGIFAPIIGFLGGILSRIFGYLVFNFVQGGLRRVAFGLLLFGAIYSATYAFIVAVNDMLVDLINSAGDVSQMMVMGVASFLPTNTPYYISIIFSYYATSLTFHLLVQSIKFKQRLAESATSASGIKP